MSLLVPSRFHGLGKSRGIMRNKILLYTVLAAMPLFAEGVAAPEKGPGELGELVTDRPDFTESSEVVGRDVAQFEMGSVLEFDRAAGVKTLSFGTPLMRWGVSKRWEMRVSGDGHITEFSHGASRKGVGDTEFGFKFKFRDQSKWLPAMGVIPFLDMPTGALGFTSGKMDPGVKFLWSKDVPLGFGLSGNLNAARVSGDGVRFVQKAITLSVGHDLFAGLAGFWEAFAFVPFDKATGPNWVYDMGLTHMVGNDAQWDVTWGHRLNQIGPDSFVQVGYTYRRKIAPMRF